MRIVDVLEAGKPTVSFEFFPPRDEDGVDALFQTIDALRPLEPDYVSVTYGAGGSTRGRTVELVKRIKRETGIESMAHLTCLGVEQDEIVDTLEALREAGAANVLPLRGDRPQGREQADGGTFQYANELVSFIRSTYDFCLGGACYPEVHPEAGCADADLDNLKRKVDAGVDFLITQLFFRNEDFYRFRDRVVAAGIRQPIVAGIMPIRNVKQVKRFTKMCGASLPAGLLAKIEAVEDDDAAVAQLGAGHASRQCVDLLGNGVAGLHFYTLNRSTAPRAIFEEIREML